MDKEIREQIAEFQMGMRYYSRGTPRKVPAGMVICHNPVIPDRPDQPHGENGFRVWKANYEWLAGIRNSKSVIAAGLHTSASIIQACTASRDAVPSCSSATVPSVVPGNCSSKLSRAKAAGHRKPMVESRSHSATNGAENEPAKLDPSSSRGWDPGVLCCQVSFWSGNRPRHNTDH